MASSASKKLLKEVPSDAEMRTIIIDLQAGGHQAAALMGGSYLDHALELLLRAKFIDLSRDDESRMFNPSSNGVLGTFNSRTRVSYALELIGPKTYKDLQSIGTIRNVFAHSLHRVDFDNTLVADDCKNLALVQTILAQNPHSFKDGAIHMYLEAVFVYHLFITANAKRLSYNKTLPEGVRPETLLKDPL